MRTRTQIRAARSVQSADVKTHSSADGAEIYLRTDGAGENRRQVFFFRLFERRQVADAVETLRFSHLTRNEPQLGAVALQECSPAEPAAPTISQRVCRKRFDSGIRDSQL